MTSRHLTSVIVVLIALAATARGAESSLTINLSGNVALEMALVAKGTFLQGSPAAEADRNGDEKQRRVTLTRDFYLGKFPVTVGQFRQFVRETGYQTEAERGASGGFGFDGKELVQRKDFTWRNPGFPQTDAHPVTLVTFDDAQAFAAWLAKKGHRRVFLPTEAQWEYACRAGTTTRFSSGEADSALREIAWYRANAGDGTRPVGQKRPNAFGLCDMSGNVYEWCRDWFGPYEGTSVSDPEETRSDRSVPPRRVLRGGSWLKDPKHCRSAARWRNTPGSRNADNGFRVAASVLAVVEEETQQPPAEAQPGRSFPQSTPDAARTANQGAPAVPPAAAGSSGLGGFLCVAVSVAGLLAVLGAIAFSVLGRKRADPADAPLPRRRMFSSGSHFTEAGDDGFWLDLAHIPAGSLVRYRCRAGGEVLTDTVMTEAGTRQFIYTGERPEDISIVEVIPPGSEVQPAATDSEPSQPLPAIMPVILPAGHERPATPPPSSDFTGFPTAY